MTSNPVVVGPFVVGEKVTVYGPAFVVCESCNGYGTISKLPYPEYTGDLKKCPYCNRGLIGTGALHQYNAIVTGLAPSDDLLNIFCVHVSIFDDIFEGRGSVALGYEMDRLDTVIPITLVTKESE